MTDTIIPNSPLILWAKGWISFKYKHPEWDVIKEMKHIVSMCGYIPYKTDPFPQILMLFQSIIDFLTEWNKKNPNNTIQIPYCCTNIQQWENEVCKIQSIYQFENRNSAVLKVILNMLFNLKINIFKVPRISYNRKVPYTTIHGKYGRPYFADQKIFDEQFEYRIKRTIN